ncbi:MAG: hypothetical protein QW179_00030 [Candidatus Hadarchaeales archaeon]
MVLMDILQAFGAITLPIIVTVILSNRQTQRIFETTTAQTYQILSRIESVLGEVKKVQEDIRRVQEDISCTLKKVRRIQEDTTCLLRKVDLGLKANAIMHNWRRSDGVTPEQAKKFSEPKVYDEKLAICYYKEN